MSRITLTMINERIKALGGKAILVRGEGYFYFCEGEADYFNDQSVPTMHLNGGWFTLDTWITEWEDRVKAASELAAIPWYADLYAFITNPDRITEEQFRLAFAHYYEDLSANARAEGFAVNKAHEWNLFVDTYIENKRIPASARHWKCPKSTKALLGS